MVDEKLQDAFRQVRRLMNEDLDKLEKGVMAGLDTGNAELAETERKLAAAERSVHLLTHQVKIAQGREIELMEELDNTRRQLARADAKLQGIRDQVADTVGSAEREPFISSVDLGEPHKDVNASIKESVVNLDRMEAEMSVAPPKERLRGLAKLLDGVRAMGPAPIPQPAPFQSELAVTKFQAPEFPEEPRRVEA